MTTRRKTAIFGGTFNPVHKAHLVLAQDALEAAALDRVLFIPCATPPHKTPDRLADATHRLAMLELALADHPAFEISDIEIRRSGTSYSIDTVRSLKDLYPEDDLTFIIGSDSLVELHLWKDIEQLLPLATFLSVARPGQEQVHACDIPLPAPWPETLSKALIEGHLMTISSSEIRQNIAQNKSILSLVPASVSAYIVQHGLYK